MQERLERFDNVSIFFILFIAVGWNFDVVLTQDDGIEDIITGLNPTCVLELSEIAFFLYNRKEPDGVIVDLESGDIPVKQNARTYFVIHGFTSEANTTRYLTLIDILVEKYNFNVFSVNWRDGACSGGIPLTQILGYPRAARNTKIVGWAIAKFIDRLIKEFQLSLKNMVIVGHSLGAHVAGAAGKQLQLAATGLPPLIIGLDPAGPGFEFNNCPNRICASDARIVEIFHTSYSFGIHRPIGDIDFYFNGGITQSQCPTLEITCSHSSAIAYLIYIMANPDCKFIGRSWIWSSFFPPSKYAPCRPSTCPVVGPNIADYPARGVFYVDTSELPSDCATVKL